MSIRSKLEFEGMQQACEVVGITLKKMQEFAKPGLSTKELDEFGYAILKSYGANPAPKKDYGFPGWCCISVNEEAAHGIPSSKKILREGDLINVDVSAEVNGYYGDNGGSFVLGKDIHELRPLVEASKEILYLTIEQIRSRVKISYIGGFIESEAKRRGFNVIRNLAGHGIGLKLHEAPHEILNFKDRHNKERFRKGSVIALETFISTGANLVEENGNGWTYVTRDGSYVAQHEHTLVVTDGYPIILTKNNGI